MHQNAVVSFFAKYICIRCSRKLNITCRQFIYLLLPRAVVKCVAPLPDAPENGKRTVYGITYGSTVTYSCNAGYKLKGSSTVTCMDDGHWNASENIAQCIGKRKHTKSYNDLNDYSLTSLCMKHQLIKTLG